MVFELTNENYAEQIENKKGYSFIDFKAKWCTPCKLQKPVIELLSVKFDKKVTFYTCDIDEEPELVNKMNIFSVPTMLLVKDGEVIAKIIGYKPVSVLEDILSSRIKKDSVHAIA